MKSSKPLVFHFLVNLAVVLASVGVIFLTNNPLGILGLFFLQQMPVFPPEHMIQREEDEEGKPIGFVSG